MATRNPFEDDGMLSSGEQAEAERRSPAASSPAQEAPKGRLPAGPRTYAKAVAKQREASRPEPQAKAPRFYTLAEVQANLDKLLPELLERCHG